MLLGAGGKAGNRPRGVSGRPSEDHVEAVGSFKVEPLLWELESQHQNIGVTFCLLLLGVCGVPPLLKSRE